VERTKRPRTRRWARILGLGLCGLLGVVVVRGACNRPEPFDPGPAPALPEVDPAAAAERLARAVRIASISPGSRPGRSPPPGEEHRAAAELSERVRAMQALHRQLAADFPRVHASLRHETISELSLLYHWQGTDPSAEPILLTAHLDVVPVEPGTESDWTHPPFSGAIDEDGFVWGRGTLDDKTGVVGLLQATELLIEQGFTPQRTIVLAFGHDEEIGGQRGAKAITAELAARGERFAFVLDEGGSLVSEAIPGLEREAALVGVAEKGFANVVLTLRDEGGHASMPPPTGAIGRLAAAVAAIEREPMPLRLDGATRQMLDGMAPHMTFPMRTALSNLWLLSPAIERVLASQPPSNATVRTTLAPTMIDAGVAPNVLAAHGEVTLNSRILPGDTVDDVLAHVREVIDDPDIEVRCDEGWEPSPVASTDDGGFGVVRRAIAHVYPEAIVVPFLTVGATDARHYAAVARQAYRFLPIRMRAADRTRLHGTDERTTVEGFADAVRFYMTVMALAAG
jgi:carboxypeptidase PM20D1